MQIVQAVRDAADVRILPIFCRLSNFDIDTKFGFDDLVAQAGKVAEFALTQVFKRIFREV
ncbi:hypothetical protein [Marinomonas mediterranea]|uniref:hypothetical protein n=1 Tax=Marinomonas mediterranea TaxID=119864 RepID=UPI002349BDB9|nr:hypothetical protein [Marinomonas mediterranea]WCN08870.1 hypothetical protein GV055_08020 [Marinomonas mediterranea]